MLEEVRFETHVNLQFAETIQTEMFENCAPEIKPCATPSNTRPIFTRFVLVFFMGLSFYRVLRLILGEPLGLTQLPFPHKVVETGGIILKWKEQVLVISFFVL